MEDYTDIIPRDVLVLLKVGEETATLKDSLDNIVTMYSEDLEIQIRSMSKVIEPVMIVVMGGVIGLVAVSIFGIIGNVMDALPSM
ncbi:MAG: type II secretion system F family protein [Candidatus Peribacteria bacterium]|nr:MAG: type II secretion system F family protein [Candidatus Peribacteria bacterium]